MLNSVSSEEKFVNYSPLHKRDSLTNEETEFAVVTSLSKKLFPSDRLCVFALSVESLEEFETPTPWPGLQP